MRTHFNEKHDEHVNLIVCNKWHKSVNLLKDLNLHLKSFEECKLKCGTCQRRYNSNFELMRHIRVHHDQSVGFACSGCTKRFQSALGLVVHFTIQHSDQLPYKCDKCLSTFAHHSLKDHQKRAACSRIPALDGQIFIRKGFTPVLLLSRSDKSIVLRVQCF